MARVQDDALEHTKDAVVELLGSASLTYKTDQNHDEHGHNSKRNRMTHEPFAHRGDASEKFLS